MSKYNLQYYQKQYSLRVTTDLDIDKVWGNAAEDGGLHSGNNEADR